VTFQPAPGIRPGAGRLLVRFLPGAVMVVLLTSSSAVPQQASMTVPGLDFASLIIRNDSPLPGLTGIPWRMETAW